MDKNTYEANVKSLQSVLAISTPGTTQYTAIQNQITTLQTEYYNDTQATPKPGQQPTAPQQTSPEVTTNSGNQQSASPLNQPLPNYGMTGTGAASYRDTAGFNPLHNYNSYNYVWTMFVPPVNKQNDPAYLFSNAPPENIIVRSSGKGTNATTAPSNAPDNVKQLVDEFNTRGIGRYDFYIDQVEMNGSFTTDNKSAITSGSMTVVEPITINGFIESIKVNCYAAGYETPFGTNVYLRLEFWGWRKDDTGNMIFEQVVNEIGQPQIRTFPVFLTDIDVDTGDRGTVYKISFANIGSIAAGKDGLTLTSVKMKGSTVFEILDNFKRSLNEAVKPSQGNENPDKYTEYDIIFDPWTTPDGNVDKFVKGDGYPWTTVKINELHRSNQEFVFPSPGEDTDKNNYRTTIPGSVKYDPTSESIQFGVGQSIAACILAVIRDSKYTEDFVIKKLEEYKRNNKGLVPWFRVYNQVCIKDSLNPETGNPTYKITYIVKPYWIHYSRFPFEGAGSWDPTQIQRGIRRSYNYVYTGKNVDVIDFKLKLNWLYYQEAPYKLGDKDQSGTTTGASPNGSVALKVNSQDTKDPINNPDGGSRQGVNPTLANDQSELKGKGPQVTPYQQLAIAMQNTINASVQEQTVFLKIIGDPFYLCTNGQGWGSSPQSPEHPGETESGEADYLGGEIYINIDFQTPRDIRDDGFYDFGGPEILPYSGLFKVAHTTNMFREGVFTQELELIRMAGQVVNKTPVVVMPRDSTSKIGEQQTQDSRPASATASGIKTQTASLAKLLTVAPGWGIPDLMGKLTQGIATLEGAAIGAIGQASNALNTTVARVDASIATALAPVGTALQFAGQVTTFAAQVGGIVAVADALLTGGLTNNTVGQTTSGYNPYSNGIRLNTSGLTTPDATSQNQANVAAQAAIISSFVEDPNMLRTLNQNYNNNVFTHGTNYNTQPSSPNNLNNVGSNVTAVTNGSTVDPTALATQLGLNPNELTGLNAGQQSDVLGKLLLVASLLPTEANLQGFKSLGMTLDNIYASTIGSLPSLQPLTTSPDAKPNEYDVQKIIASGGNPSNLPGALGIGSVAALIAMLGLKPESGVGNSLSTTAATDKLITSVEMQNTLLAGNSSLSQAQLGLGSVESNAATVTSTIDGYGGYYKVTKTVNTLYGTQKTLSPLDVLMTTKKLNG